MLELLRARAVNEIYRRKERRGNYIICGESVEFRFSKYNVNIFFGLRVTNMSVIY